MIGMALFAWVCFSAPLIFLPIMGVDQSIIANYSIVLQIISPIMAAFLCYKTASYFANSQDMRRAWKLLGSGVLLWGIGAILYSIYPLLHNGQETPYPWYSDFGYLLMYLPCLLAFIFVKQHLNVKVPGWGVLAGIIVFCGSFVLAVYFNINKLSTSDSVPTYIVTLLYIFGDPILLGSTAFIISALGEASEARAWWFVSIGFFLFYIANVTYTYFVLVGNYISGSFLDIGWILGFGFIGVAALMARATETNDSMGTAYIP